MAARRSNDTGDGTTATSTATAKGPAKKAAPKKKAAPAKRAAASSAQTSSPEVAPRHTGSKETHTDDLYMEQPSDIVLPNDGPVVHEQESIVAVENTQLNRDYLEALKFNEDELTIMLQHTSEENAPTIVDVYVNGVAKWVRVGVPEKLPRKYVEALIRSKPIAVNTQHEDVGAKVITNRIVRSMRAKYPLSVQHDPSPKGNAWLQRIVAEQ